MSERERVSVTAESERKYRGSVKEDKGKRRGKIKVAQK